MRLRDEYGVAAPSPVVMLSVIAVAMAGIAFVATRDSDDTRPLQTVSQPDESPPPTTPAIKPQAKAPKLQPLVRRNAVFVEVYNNSAVRGLAGATAADAQALGWDVVGSDNWVGMIPASTVYYPPRLERAARLLGKDLKIARLRPAVEPMRFDRLTVILTADYA